MYRHTQIGYVTLAVSVAVAGIVGYAIASGRTGAVLWVVLMVPVLVAIQFATLTTEVTQERFRFWFGPGIIRQSFFISDIEFCDPVQNPWFYGWGIRWTPHGWLYNVSGSSAVELHLRSGKRLRVGTDEPTELSEAIMKMKGG